MSDGQEKTDDLIAELAKLMASGGEGEGKPGPKLVSQPAAPRAADEKPATPAAPTIRIPGMDAPSPIARSEPQAQVPAAPVPQAAPRPPMDRAPAPLVRIPGMDMPTARTGGEESAQAVPQPTPPAAAATAAVRPPLDTPRPAPPVSLGTGGGSMTPAATVRPQPQANWQDREIPKPVPARTPPPMSPPISAAPPRSEAPAIVPFVAPPVARTEPEAPIVAAKPAPEDDGFDFDFGFGSGSQDDQGDQHDADPEDAPEPQVMQAEPEAETDPIADLIAAELDVADSMTAAAQPVVPVRLPVLPPPTRTAGAAVVAPAMPAAARATAATVPPARPAAAPVVTARATEVDAEADRFAVAPVFGPAPKDREASPEPDPMDEIESLIGEAVRVELSAPTPPPQTRAAAPERPRSEPGAAPVVPPLTTGFAPRRAAIKDTEPRVSDAEAAILAAAAAADTDTLRVEKPVTAGAAPYKRQKVKLEREGRNWKPLIGMGVAATLFVAAGLGLYWVIGLGGADDGEAPVLTADAEPVKEAPPATPANTQTQGSVVFNELDGTGQGVADEQLVSRDNSETTSVADVARTVGLDNEATNGESELANRRVRTVTVRPDGSIVSGDDAVAGTEALPVSRPNVPELPGADVQPSQLLAALPTADSTPAAAETPAPAADSAAFDLAAIAPSDPSTINPSIEAPVPMPRPTNRASLNQGGSTQTASASAPAPLDLVAPSGGNSAPAADVPRVSSAGGSYVQLSSQRTENDAMISLRTTERQLSGVLGGQRLEIRRVDLGSRGVWYRVVLPTSSFPEATRACATLKANGADCLPING